MTIDQNTLDALVLKPEQIEFIPYDSIKATYGKTIDELTLCNKYIEYLHTHTEVVTSVTQKMQKESQNYEFWLSPLMECNLILGAGALGLLLGYVLDVKTVQDGLIIGFLGLPFGMWRGHYLRTAPKRYVETLLSLKQQIRTSINELNGSFIQSLLEEERKHKK